MLYDNNLLEQIAEEKENSSRRTEKYDESLKQAFPERSGDIPIPCRRNLANMQFDYLKKKAMTGIALLWDVVQRRY